MLPGVDRSITDRRLRDLKGARCAECEVDAAAGTGHASEDRGQWFVEYRCEACGEVFFAWRADVDAIVLGIVRAQTSRVRSESVAISGEIGADGQITRKTAAARPLAETYGPLLLHVRESASAIAQATRRPLEFAASLRGTLVHREEPDAVGARAGFSAFIEAPEVLGPLRALFTRAELERVPAELGRGAHAAVLTWYGGGAPQVRTLRWSQSGQTRDLDGAGPAEPGLVELLDGLLTLIDWVDARGPTPPWPAAAPLFFPPAEDLARGRRAARLYETHDWDGATPHARAREVIVREVGVILRREWSLGPPRAVVTREVATPMPAKEVAAFFADLQRLDPASFRRRLGFVQGACTLDTTYEQHLSFFDGLRAHTTTLVTGYERAIGIAVGDTPPQPREAAAFAALERLRG